MAQTNRLQMKLRQNANSSPTAPLAKLRTKITMSINCSRKTAEENTYTTVPAMCSEAFPKEFEKTDDVLPFTKYGLSSIQEFQDAEKDIHHLEYLKKAGLTYEEINLYEENEAGLLDKRKKIESNVMKEKLYAIYSKLRNINEIQSSDGDVLHASTSKESPQKILDEEKLITYYPEGHPMNQIKDIEQNLFGHLQNNDIPITKRRKILRRLERKKERILAEENRIDIGTVTSTHKVDRPGSLWDLKELPRKLPVQKNQVKSVIGPHKPTMYSIKNKKIVRLEPINQELQEQYRAVDIVMPVNNAEVQLLEGTKMCIDDIKKIERFKDYKPGIPSKTLYLKNIAPSVTQEQLSLLFNQFMLANGGPIDVRLMSGRMRGQAFVAFQTEDIAIQALEETNGTILSGRPIIVQFGRNTDRIQEDNR